MVTKPAGRNLYRGRTLSAFRGRPLPRLTDCWLTGRGGGAVASAGTPVEGGILFGLPLALANGLAASRVLDVLEPHLRTPKQEYS